nr:MAG TPA: hypothetical protein [Caudoviricetes sp.]
MTAEYQDQKLMIAGHGQNSITDHLGILTGARKTA